MPEVDRRTMTTACNSTGTRKIAACPVQFSTLRLFFRASAAAFLLFAAVATAQDVQIEKVADGLGFPEGPVWHPDGYLLFSDIHNATIERLLPQGGTEPWFNQGIKTNGLILNPERTKLLACGHSVLQLLAIDLATKEFEILARDHHGRPFLNVNDIAVDPEGNIFFTDPKWGAGPGDIQGVYCYSTTGALTLAARVEKQPNGVAVSADRKWLYVARSGGNDIWRFKLEAGGRLTAGAPWADLGPDSGPDGMTVARDGTVYQAQSKDGQVAVISPEGKILRRVKVFDRMATNCELQGDNENILYVTGGGSGQDKKTGGVFRLTFPAK